MIETFYTVSGIRLRRHSRKSGDLNWLLLPGGPGIGSESLIDLADCVDVPGSIWLVDLPGDGSNRSPSGAPADPYSCWPDVLVEAAKALPNVVFAGHSTGGMYLLATPELEKHIIGLVLIDTAPDASWHERFVEMTQLHPLPAVLDASSAYEADRRDENIAAIVVASAEWNFAAAGVERGRELLSGMPYNGAAIDWSEANFDHVYQSKWWPHSVPVLVLGGEEDRIVWQGSWRNPKFHTTNATFRTIKGGGHFPWVENPTSVSAAFDELAIRIMHGAQPAQDEVC